MFKTPWTSRNAADDEPELPPVSLDRARIKMLHEFFPIGRKVRYFPEYKREIVFDTIIIAYCANDQYLYSRDAIQLDDTGTPEAFLVGPKKLPLPLEKVTRFQLMVPDTTDMERTLDYIRRASIGRARQFLSGNSITLFAETGERGVPMVDTLVHKRLKPSDGPYADHRMILLGPDLDTLSLADQRKKQRVAADMRVDLLHKANPNPFHCALADFSETSLRLRAPDAAHPLPAMAENDEAIVVIDFGEPGSLYRIKGTVFRGDAEACVIKLARLFRGTTFQKFTTMDILEIKTGLLNYNVG